MSSSTTTRWTDSQGEIRDLFRGDALRAWELDGEDQSDNAEIDLTQSVDELETAVPNGVTPYTVDKLDGWPKMQTRPQMVFVLKPLTQVQSLQA